MADYTTKDGKEITVDLYKITLQEYDSLFDAKIKANVQKDIISKTFGMTADEFNALPMPDGARLNKLFWTKAKEFLDEPKNSPSASTSP